MSKMEKVVDRVYIAGGLVLLMTVIMAMSSCGTKECETKECRIQKECCKKTIEEVYKHEGLYIYE